MTIKECIDKVDNLKPNQYSLEDKVDWLSFVEMTIINDVLKTHEGYDGRYDNFKGYSADRTDVELIVPSPYDRLYTAFLTMKIDESNGETARYNNSATLYNSYMGEYRKYYNKTHMPIDVTKKAPANVVNNSINLTDAMYAVLVKDLTHILTQYFSGAVSPDKIYDIVMSYMQNNAELFKGKDGKTPIKGQDYFTDAEIKAITDELSKYAKDEIQGMSKGFENTLKEINSKYNNLSSAVDNQLPNKVDKVVGMGLSEVNYTANDQQLLYRNNSQIDALEQNMAYKVDAVPGKVLSSNDYIPEDKALLYEMKTQMSGKVDKEFGKGLSTEDYTSEEKYLLASVSSKVTNIESEIAYKVDAEPGKGLSTEDYTTEDKRLLYEHEEEINGIAANASDIAKLSGRVDTNAGDIATNATAIEANAKGIVDFGTRVTEAENDIAAVDERLTQTKANVKNNQNAIDANSDAIAANAKNIAQNLQSIADIEDRAIICTASGENIHLSDSSNSKLKGMRVFGKTIQDMFCNNQGTRTITTNGCTYTLVDGKTEMVVTGTSTTAFSIPLSKLTLAAGTYSISFSGATYGSVYMYISNASNGQTILGGIYSTNTLTITETTDVMINMVILAEKIFDNAVIKVSLTGNLSPETPHSFISVGDSGSISVNVKNEPDFDNQMLSISTPTALFGVPVAKDGNYIDSAGKQWICDEIDLNRGVHIKRLALSTVAFSHFGTHSDGRVYGVMYAPLKIEKSDAGALCEKAEFVSAKITADCFYENTINIVFSGDESDTEETLKAKFEGCEIIYILANAVETPLTTEQIAAYKSLHTNKTTTNIYNSENAYMQVEYVADTKSYIDNKIEKVVAELSAAILTE